MTDAAAGARDRDGTVLSVRTLSKTFPGTRALADVCLDVERGEIHALLGGNGSGKSTLIKILAGVHTSDPGGQLRIGGSVHDTSRWSPAQAKTANLHFVHQNPGVFVDLTVAENIAIGRGFETGVGGRVRWRRVNQRTRQLLERFHIDAEPTTPVIALRPADRTMVAIARALQDQEGEAEGVLVLDEPTASLPESEVEVLHDALRRYAAAGQTIIYVTHRLDEVLDIADRVSVLRDGSMVGTTPRSELNEARLVELIVGRSLDRVFPEMPEIHSDSVVLEARHLAGGPLRDVSFRLRRGEVLGIAGLLGSGRSELLGMLFGDLPFQSGQLLLDGRPVRFARPKQAIAAGIALVPEDRAGDATFADMTVRENLSAARVGEFWNGLRLRHGQERADARRTIGDYLIKTSSDSQALSTLSGGNQQKVVVARWLRRNPKVLLLDEPTQGVDVGARAEIYGLVRNAVQDGTSVIVVTSDFEELAHVVDRAIVIGQGRVVAELTPPLLEAARLTELAYTATQSLEEVA
jgi:ribose transport system ATP-binding protein